MLRELAIHLWNHLSWFISTVVLAVEPVMEYFIPGYKKWIEQKDPDKKLRHLVIRGIAVAGIAVAFVLAFKDEYELAHPKPNGEHLAAPQSEQKNGETTDPHHWQALSDEEQSALRSKLRNVSQSKTVRVISSDVDGRDLADSFQKVFNDLHWNIQPPFYNAGNYGVVGLKVFQDDGNTRIIADAIEQATHGRLNVPTGADTYGYITIIIGPKS